MMGVAPGGDGPETERKFIQFFLSCRALQLLHTRCGRCFCSDAPSPTLAEPQWIVMDDTAANAIDTELRLVAV